MHEFMHQWGGGVIYCGPLCCKQQIWICLIKLLTTPMSSVMNVPYPNIISNDNDNILFDHNVQIEITIFNSLENQIINLSGDYY